MYSVKLKLELNILTKLVDLVDGPSADRSMTLDTIAPNTIPGQAQLEIHQELSRPAQVRSRSTTIDKGDTEHIEDNYSKAICSASVLQASGEKDEITRVLSNRSRYTARTASRESDILYADFLRDMK